MTYNITVLISGNGTNLQEIIDRSASGVLGRNVQICHVISNKKDAFGLTRASNAGIPTTYLPYVKDIYATREDYDMVLRSHVVKYQPNLIVLAGWMHVLSKSFLDQISIPIINLHPALPGRFPGVNAIEQAFNCYQEHVATSVATIPDKLSNTNPIYHNKPITGCMVHLVVPEIDAGQVIISNAVPINRDDTLDTLTERVHWMEKFTLIQAIIIMIQQNQTSYDANLANSDANLANSDINLANSDANLAKYGDNLGNLGNSDANLVKYDDNLGNSDGNLGNSDGNLGDNLGNSGDIKLISRGKVRNIWRFGDGMGILAMVASDRCSSFDRHICNISGKGYYLNQISKIWFSITSHIISNHLLFAINKLSIVKECQVIPFEIVVRGYMARSRTSTSLWTNYHKCPPGNKVYCGISFPDDLEPNCRLPFPVVTPTTKSTQHDIPISAQEIISGNYGITRSEWEYISSKAIELYNYGSIVADRMGLILADTKFEFGRDQNGIIMLIDEVLTPDSSRFWLKNTYRERLAAGLDPESLDKDLIRQYVAHNCDPYDLSTPIPAIPDNLIATIQEKYRRFWRDLSTISRL
jgi:phosphoribosylaminoimidazole-succinocarboxamide synthase